MHQTDIRHNTNGLSIISPVKKKYIKTSKNWNPSTEQKEKVKKKTRYYNNKKNEKKKII